MRYAVSLGCFLLALALGAIAWDVYFLTLGGHFKLSTWGEFWYGIHSASLNGLKTGVESYISTALWNSVVRPLLNLPTLLIIGLPGAILATLPWTLPWLKKLRRRKQVYRPEQPTT